MAPKKKNNKKGGDWEAELGEAPTAAAPETNDAPAEADAEEEFPQGGLMAMLRKKQKKKKNQQTEDFVEGEDPAAEQQENLAEKAPVEASIEDEFALPDKKGKGKNAAAKSTKEADEDDERGADGKVLTKAQKEKLKKEREKQRKKENVGSLRVHTIMGILLIFFIRLRRKRQLPPLRREPQQRSQRRMRR